MKVGRRRKGEAYAVSVSATSGAPSEDATLQNTAELPNGWRWATIGEITQPVEKVSPLNKPQEQFTYLDIASIDNIINQITEPKTYYGKDAPSRARQKVRADDVLFSTVRTYLKNIAQVPIIYDGQVASTGFAVLRATEAVLPTYIFYYCLTHSFLNPLSEIQRGTSYPAVRDGDVRAQPIPLAPLAEQRRIVAVIERLFTKLDAGVAALKRAQANLRRYKASVVKSACEGKLTAQSPHDEPAYKLLARILHARRAKWEADLRAKGKDPSKTKYEEPHAPNIGELPELPKGWCWTTSDQVGDIQLGRQRSPQHHQGTHMRPYLRVANVFEDRIDTSDVLEMNFTPTEYEIYKLGYGDILLNEGQSPKFLGRPAMYRDEIPGACFQNTLIRFRASEAVLPFYALYVFRAHMHSGRFAKEATITTNIAHLSAGRFATVEFPLAPLAEQHRIILEMERRLSVVAALEQTLVHNLARAEKLRQSILKRAFAGRLVGQDPSDLNLAESA